MEPAVPFALLGATQLLLIAACAGLAVAALVLRRSVASVVVAAGALVLVLVETRTALLLGVPASDGLALARAAGALVVGAGLYAGGLGGRRPRLEGTPGIVVPLAATGPTAWFAGGGLLAAALAALFARRDAVGAWVAAAFVLLAGASFTAPQATSGIRGPLLVVGLRAGGAVALLVGLALLARASLLSKVVGAILAGVLAMAVAAVGVVGTVVVSSYETQSQEIVTTAADARVNALNVLGETAAGQALLASQICTTPALCQGLLLGRILVNGKSDFVVKVPRDGVPISLAGRPALSPSELLGLRGAAPVQAVLHGDGTAGPLTSLFSNVRLTGSPPGVAVVGVAVNPNTRTGSPGKPDAVYVYGVRLDADYTQADVFQGGYGLSLLVGDPLQVVASNSNEKAVKQLLSIVQAAGADRGVPVEGLTIGSAGSQPTVRLMPLLDLDQHPVGLLALTRDAQQALATESAALRLLLVTALLATLVVAVVAVVLGRRTVDPVRRLTAAAERVAAGDLTVTTAASGGLGRDEVGTLARTFDAMTGSLSRLTGDLRNSAARLETVLGSMSDGLLATDGDGVVTSVNQAALVMLGLEAEDVVGEALSLVADVRDSSGRQLADLSLRLLDEPAQVHRLDGSSVPVRVALTPLQGALGAVFVLRDTTREREVERMKTEFLSNVSHELRTPLTPIRGYAELLIGKPGLASETVAQFAATIRDESVKMGRVVDLLVDVAALEAGRVSVVARPVAVMELFEVRIGAWKARAPARRHDLKKRVAAGLPPVQVDPMWLGKALDELIDNAMKYTPQGTPITLTAGWSPDGARVRVAVKDAGPGIDEADQGALFTSFEQVDGSDTRRVGGLGLGLAFVARLAQDAGFPLTVTSRTGKGSEFALDLPVSEEPPVARVRRTTKKAV